MTRSRIQPRHDAVWLWVVAMVSVVSLLLAACTGSGHRNTSVKIPTTAGISTPLIYIDATKPEGSVNKAVLGDALLTSQNAQGSFDARTGQFYPKFIQELTQVIKPGSLRFPGGTAAEVFHWRRAVGPRAARQQNAALPNAGPTDSNVGPDEIGRLLEVTGAIGVGTANFGTGTAREAAGFVAYMTGKAGSSPWADMRVENGHPKPYEVPYWEVGNEEYLPSALYWRSGTPVKVGGPPGACSNPTTCLYIYGGSTRFTRQATVGYADWSPGAATASGKPGRASYVKYPPIAPGSDRVYVGGSAWTRVQSLASAAPHDHVYAIDRRTGRIDFGNGVHGAVPPAGERITASYVSGPHDGFLAYYKAIKAANPNVKVCATDSTPDFISTMGDKLPYDCLQDHEYTTPQNVANDVPIRQYQDSMIGYADDQLNRVLRKQATIRRHAGRDVPLVESEYGQLLSARPATSGHYQQSLAEALQNATQLTGWIRAGIPVADRQLLAGSTRFGDDLPLKRTAAIATDGPDPIVQATGWMFSLFAPLSGGTIVATQTLKSPKLPNAGSSEAGALNVIAVRKADAVYLLGINRSATQGVNAAVSLAGAVADGQATYTRLNGESALSYNNSQHPNAVRATTGKIPISGTAAQLTWPAHSITTLRIPVQRRPLQTSIDLGHPAEAAPGGATVLDARIRGGKESTSVRVAPSLPAGWQAQPKTATVKLLPGKTANTTFRVSVPRTTAQRSYPVGVVVRADSGAIAWVSTTSVPVRKAG